MTQRHTGDSYFTVFEPGPKRVRVMLGGQFIADSLRAYLVRPGGPNYRYFPGYYFPREDVRMDLLQPTTLVQRFEELGEASYWTVKVGDRIAENGAWCYHKVIGKIDLGAYIAFEWDKMDGWFEEAEEVFVHAHDPYHRIDVLHGSRHVVVVVGGEKVAETRSSVLLFETGLPTRYYFLKSDVRLDLLVPSDTITGCAYKGKAQYYSVKIGNKIFPDMAWYYNFPTTEAAKIAGRIAFFNERVDELYVDGTKQPKPKTQWSLAEPS